MRIRVFKFNVGPFYVFRHLHCTRFGKLAVQVVCVWCIGRPPLPISLSISFHFLIFSFFLPFFHFFKIKTIFTHQICASVSRLLFVYLISLLNLTCNNNPSIFFPSILVFLVYFCPKVLKIGFQASRTCGKFFLY